jgi:glycosyltransferase involved in cell wall biosynthesis
MRIGFDAKRILNNGTGLGNHGRILLYALLRDYPQHEYLLYSPKAKEEFMNELSGDFKVLFPDTKKAQAFGGWWRSMGVTRQLLHDRVEVYHGISNELPFNIHRSGVKTIVTIHDLIFLKHTDQYPWVDRQVYSTKTKYAAKHADRIIAVSEETRQDLINIYRVPEHKITVVHPSIDAAFFEPVDAALMESVRIKHQLPKKYILNVGSFFTRKNQAKLIEAYDLIKDKIEEDLVLVGYSGNMYESILQLVAQKKLQDRVQIRSSVTNQDLPYVYSAASLYVFPSMFEGFGAPLVEAMSRAVPVLASDIPCFREVGGAAVQYFDPNSRETIAAMMQSVLEKEAQRKEMIANGSARAKNFTDANFASGVMKLYLD